MGARQDKREVKVLFMYVVLTERVTFELGLKQEMFRDIVWS